LHKENEAYFSIITIFMHGDILSWQSSNVYCITAKKLHYGMENWGG